MNRMVLASGARLAAWALAGILLVAGGQGIAQSGNPFAPIAFVNDRAITAYELEQRKTVLRLFRAPGNLDDVALEQLIDDRLRQDATVATGISLAPEEIREGMAEFAGRTNMDLDTFLSALAAQGVSEETLRDFVKAGLGWRKVVQARFAPRAQVTDAEVDRALALTGRSGGAVVQLAEIMLPARNGAEQQSSEALAQELRGSINSTADFAAAARRYSVAPSKDNGGRTGRSTPLSELPPALRSQILTLAPGDVSEPISGGTVIALFQLLSLSETGFKEAETVSIDYAEYLIPGGQGEAARKEAGRVLAKVDSCDDLYGINLKQAPERLARHTRPVQEIPQSVAVELAKLDEGEVSTLLTRGDNMLFLMLCSRAPALGEEAPNRDAIRRSLFSKRVAAYGDGYLAQLRADAIIRYP
ncbi:peptidylprolyl isomerase [Tropicimonas sp. TH_r6]|uniref:peptidylprolyl isomerase n=1 Tax=Tropicimonas sp. TH_r6 TaxID=3082085 RepID=UPI0029533C37|nr:peptidylprolyl isomerase [Tropicimonas sp. TH_r6]MDV7141687.1 peptidylprolyl isomerase [Tropicimonas sp. TH_r6]